MWSLYQVACLPSIAALWVFALTLACLVYAHHGRRTRVVGQQVDITLRNELNDLHQVHSRHRDSLSALEQFSILATDFLMTSSGLDSKGNVLGRRLAIKRKRVERVGTRMRVGSGVAVLDFDSVAYQFEPFKTRVAWQTACALWPDRMAMEKDVSLGQAGARRAWVGGNWWELIGKDVDGLPKWLRAKLRQCQSIVATEVDSVVLARLLLEEALANSGRPLAVGEITSNWSPYYRKMLLQRWGTPEEVVMERFSVACQEWLDKHSADLLPDCLDVSVADAIRTAISLGLDVYVTTENHDHMVQSLLEKANITVEDDRILSLESREQEEKVLCQLQQSHQSQQLIFVGGRPETLRAICNNAELFSAQLYFIEWGHAHPDESALVNTWPRVRSLTNGGDLASVFERAHLTHALKRS